MTKYKSWGYARIMDMQDFSIFLRVKTIKNIEIVVVVTKRME